jgi:hypothetical protein
MKASELPTLLGNFDNLSGAKTKGLGRLFDGYGDKTVDQAVKALSKNKPAGGKSSPAIRILREVLSQFENLLRSAEAKAAGDIAKLNKLLDGCTGASIDEIVKEILEWGKTPTSEDYISLLKQHARDSVQFDQTIERLKSDKNIKIDYMFVIARGFLGRDLDKKIKTRPAALKEIIKWQFLDARRDARGAVIHMMN